MRYFGALAAQLLNDHPLDDDMFMYIHPPGVKLKIHTAVLAGFFVVVFFPFRAVKVDISLSGTNKVEAVSERLRPAELIHSGQEEESSLMQTADGGLDGRKRGRSVQGREKNRDE